MGFDIPYNGKGNYVIVAGGTGILPFLDFFYLLLKKVTYEYFDEKDDSSQGIAKAFNTDQYRNAFNHGFSVTFYGAFRSDDDFYGSDIIDNLYKIC